jgi:hypothetical protein
MERHQIKPSKKLYRRRTAAEILDCDVSLLKRLEKMGRLTGIRIGLREIFYKCEEIDALANGKSAARRRPR